MDYFVTWTCLSYVYPVIIKTKHKIISVIIFQICKMLSLSIMNHCDFFFFLQAFTFTDVLFRWIHLVPQAARPHQSSPLHCVPKYRATSLTDSRYDKTSLHHPWPHCPIWTSITTLDSLCLLSPCIFLPQISQGNKSWSSSVLSVKS